MHENILVVEDEYLVALDIDRSLSDRGYAVTTASSSDEAVKRANQSSPDLILMDVKLNGTDGIETARRIKAILDVPVVYLTAYSDDATLERARRTEPYGYLIKPFNTRELCATVEMALQRHRQDRHRVQQARVGAFLAEASARMTQSLDYETVIARAAELLVPRYADSCLIRMLPIDQFLPSVAIARPDGLQISDPGSLVASVIENGAARVEAVGDVSDLARVLGKEHASALAARGITPWSCACVPIRARGQLLGALLLVSSERTAYTGERLAAVDEFVHHFSMAVDNALLYRAAQVAIHEREDFLAVVWHDLRGSLEVALAQAEMLALSAKHARPLISAAHRITQLLDDQLLAASIAAGRLSIERATHRASDVVMEAVELLRPLCAEKAIVLRAELGNEPIDVSCDRRRIVEVLSHLIRNAIKVTQPGGSITVRLGRDDTGVRFEVTDGGPGIPREKLQSLFEPIERTALGLYIAKGIVERHGGTIRADTVAGPATTVSFTLPETKAA